MHPLTVLGRSTIPLLVVAVITACASTPQTGEAGGNATGMNFYVLYDFNSDPPGADLYDDTGHHHGKTQEDAPVSLMYTYFDSFIEVTPQRMLSDRYITLF